MVGLAPGRLPAQFDLEREVEIKGSGKWEDGKQEGLHLQPPAPSPTHK